MSHSLTNLLYHMVFSTKKRAPLLTPEVRDRLHPYMAQAVKGENGIALIVNSVPDHLHMLVKLHQDCRVSDFLRAIKSNSSGWIHRTFPDLHSLAWQTGYRAFTVSASQVDRVRRYIANQEEHHRKMTFQEEFIALLKANGIEYDEPYLWG